MDKKDIDSNIEKLTRQIKELEDELIEELKAKEEELFFTIHNGKVKFEESIIKKGRKKIVSSVKYLSSFSFLAVLTIPFIWLLLIPAFILDIAVTIYQYICFPIYKIPIVKRGSYIIIDRYNLFYLDRIEKINCWYCEYFNGVISYVREIAARTEQFWCPIKHSKHLKDKHSRYDKFFEYGDYKSYRKELEKRRDDFHDIKN
ncbi:MAG: hypothetical protein U9Q33_02465 [Campylobacterota bacterium]|nr:hypothetical protein [Campylobacterota bacterium]